MLGSERVTIEPFSDVFNCAMMRFGFMELCPTCPAAPASAAFDAGTLSYFLTRRVLVPSPETGMPACQDQLYIMMARAARRLPRAIAASRPIEPPRSGLG
ncbi:KUP/HAK/KT family potassium transporter [Methylobacterium dankookense]|uniref:KUP/HAK/KT family potassium transporter n=1 Tax=Methylobacterium dankookense TaxID=560405 RepID=UPI003571469F